MVVSVLSVKKLDTAKDKVNISVDLISNILYTIKLLQISKIKFNK